MSFYDDSEASLAKAQQMAPRCAAVPTAATDSKRVLGERNQNPAARQIRAKLKADAASAAAKAEAAAAAREAAQPSAAERRASAREKSRAEFRAKIAADRRGRSPSKRDDKVEVLAGPIPPLSPARPPVVAPVSPGTTDAEVQDLVAKLRATLARRKDKAPSDDDVVRAVLAGRADAWPPPPRRTGEEFFDARS